MRRRRWLGVNGSNSIPLAAFDLNFAAGQYFQTGVGVNHPIGSYLTTTRASVGTASDSSGNWSSFSSNIPRITNQGLLVEESRTNSIRNNTAQGLVAGSPGTYPTNYSTGSIGTLTQTLAGPFTSKGVTYFTVNLTGTTSNGGVSIAMEAAATIVAATGQSWAFTPFLAITAGSTTNVSSISIIVQEQTSAGAFVKNDTSGNFNSALTSTITQFPLAGVFTLSGGATVARIQPFVNLSWSSGVAINITLGIGWPQLELGTFATSPILTTNAAVTRAADVIVAANTLTAGTSVSLFGIGTPTAPIAYGTNQTLVSYDDGTTNNRVFLARAATNANTILQNVSNGTSVFIPVLVTTWAQSQPGTIAGTTTNLNQAVAFGGNLLSTTSTGSFPISPSQIHIGTRYDGTSAYWNGYISHVTIWPTVALSTSLLQQIT